MTQNEKDLLVKDLCGRLLYGVKCIEKTPIEDFKDKNLWEIDRVRADTFMFGMSNCYVCYGQYDDIHNIKPYLFPLDKISGDMWSKYLATCVGGNASFPTLKSFEWCNEHHVDYRGLIPMGLALDATGLNIY